MKLRDVKYDQVIKDATLLFADRAGLECNLDTHITINYIRARTSDQTFGTDKRY